MAQHVAIHDNDLGDFMCDLCSEMFTIRYQLKQHSQKHKNTELPSQNDPSGNGGPENDFLASENFKSESADQKPASKVTSLADAASDQSTDPPMSGMGDNSERMLVSAISVVDIKQEPKDSDFTSDLPESSNTAVKFGVQTPAYLSQFPVSTMKTAYTGSVPLNSRRASVISGMFKIADEGVDDPGETGVSDTVKMPRESTPGNVSKTDTPQSQTNRLFDAHDFTNSPDFSSLTDDNLPFDPFLRTKESVSALGCKITDKVVPLPSADKFASGKNYTLSKHENVLNLLGALKHRSLIQQNSNVSKSDSHDSSASDTSENVRSSVAHAQLSKGPGVGGMKQSILHSAIEGRLQGTAQVSAGDYMNLLHKTVPKDLKQNFPPKTLTENIDSKSRSDTKTGSQASLHSVLDILKGQSSAGHVKAQIDTGSLDLSTHGQTQVPLSNILKSKVPVNKSDITSVRSLSSGQSSSASRHKQQTDLLFAQSFLNPTFMSNPLSSTGIHSGIAGKSSAQEREKRPLGGFISMNDQLQSGFLFSMEGNMKDNLSADKSKDEPSGLLSNF